ncbi:MAG: M18 family aminopeptidase [Cellvibrionales bacterium TMED49]|nr:M18 family aminopeptidase [Porticoccaceae bacterium]OUU39127.1 MAG: M18 family aminopeptidase [Cellvibrionales bacterium TMED49]
MRIKQLNQRLYNFLDHSPTPFHAVLQMSQILEKAGFTHISETENWCLHKGGKYFVTRNQSTLIAFIVGESDPSEFGARVVGAHTDSPTLMVKPQSEIRENGFLQLGVEVYGGALLNPWFDRDLSIAGRVVCQSSEGKLSSHLIDLKRPVAFIPSLAIHLDKEANKNRSINPQTDLSPIVLQLNTNQDLREVLQKECLNAELMIIDYELYLYDSMGAMELGLQNEFFSSGRLDNLLSCFLGVEALTQADSKHFCALVCNDHEEVGSISANAAGGTFLESVFERIFVNRPLSSVLTSSMFVSCDNAHAVHPNYKRQHDMWHQPVLNRGPVIKVNAKQRYATTSLTSSIFKKICLDAGVPTQTFVSRSDLACGSTIGPITSARLGIPTIDVGIPQLAMHSCRETAGVKDPVYLGQALEKFFNFPNPVAV